MKKWFVFAVALVFALALAACNKHTSDAPEVTTGPTQSAPTSPTQTAPTTPTIQVLQAGKDQLLAAWTGERTDEKMIEAIGEYEKNYKTIVPDAEKTAVSFAVDFKVSSCQVSNVAPVNDKGVTGELTGYYIWVEPRIDGNQITILIDWWNHNDPWTQRSEVVWSHLVCVTDADGLAHYYYFRVDYSAWEKVQVNHFRNVCNMEDGMVLDMGELGYVYVKSNWKANLFQMVYLEYYESNLKQQKGKFTDVDGKEKEYAYVLENKRGIREAANEDPIPPLDG